MMIEEDTVGRKGRLLTSTKTVNCNKLRSQLFQLCKEKDVNGVRSIYQLYLDDCFKNNQENVRIKAKEYFENFLDSFLTDEEKEIYNLTLKNTQLNKENVKIDDKITSDDGRFDDDSGCCNGSSAALLSSPKVAEGKIRKQVQINLEPEIKLIERRKRKQNNLN